MEIPAPVLSAHLSHASDSYASLVVLFDCNFAITFQMVHKINVCFACTYLHIARTNKHTEFVAGQIS